MHQQNIYRFIKSSIVFCLLIAFAFGNPNMIFAGTHPAINTSISCGSVGSTDLRTHMAEQVDSRLGNLATSTSLSLWSVRSTVASSGPWVRNTNSWTVNGANDLDFTGVSPFNSVGNNNRAGTLISPRNIITAHHYPLTQGTKIIFVDSNNVAYERTVVGVIRIGTSDIDVSELDSDLPDSITYYPIIPDTAILPKMHRYDYDDVVYHPMISLTQEDDAYVHAYGGYNGYNGISGLANVLYHYSFKNLRNFLSNASIALIPNYAKRNEFSGDMRVGDSGDANFFVIDNKLALLGVHNSAGSFEYLGAYIPEINAAMSTLGGEYQVTEMNLDCFTSYTMNHRPNITDTSGWYQYVYSTDDYDMETGNLLIDENMYFDSENPFYKFKTTDLDGDSVELSVVESPTPYFNLATSTGNEYTLTLSQPFNFNALPTEDATGSRSHVYTIRLLDSQTPRATTTLSYYFTIKDNNRPLFSSSSYAFSIAENSLVSSILGTTSAVLQNNADTITYSLTTNPSSAFTISPTTGQITVANPTLLDYEATTSIRLTVQAVANLGGSTRIASSTLQSQSATSTTNVTVTIVNVADTPVVSSGGGSSGGGGGGGSSSPVVVSTPAITASTSASVIPTTSTIKNPLCPANLTCVATTQNISIAPSQDLKLGITHPDVKILQQFLNSQGFIISSKGSGSIGNESTYFGPATRAALIKFQQKNNIFPAQGFYGPVTKKVMQQYTGKNNSTVPVRVQTPVVKLPVLSFGNTGSEVKKLRSILREKGYFDPYGTAGVPVSAATETSYYGETTVSAVKKFQCDMKVVCSGNAASTGWGAIGPKTRAVLGL